jgi:hypothetical protein
MRKAMACSPRSGLRDKSRSAPVAEIGRRLIDRAAVAAMVNHFLNMRCLALPWCPSTHAHASIRADGKAAPKTKAPIKPWLEHG